MPNLNKSLVLELAGCEWLDKRENVIVLRTLGVCKTHTALGIIRCLIASTLNTAQGHGPALWKWATGPIPNVFSLLIRIDIAPHRLMAVLRRYQIVVGVLTDPRL